MAFELKELPIFARDYLAYMDTVRNCSENTIREYFYDLRLFLKFIKRQIATGANLIYGKRNFSPFVMPPARIMSNFLTSLIVSLKIKNRIYDSQCGYRLYDLKLIKNMQIKTDKYQTETELLIKFAKLSAKFDFVPIKTIYDKEKSYISHVRDIKNFIKVILNT